MGNGIVYKKFGECCLGKGTYGIGAPAVEFKEYLPKYIRITDIDELGRYSTQNVASVDDKDSENYILREGDIVFARTGNTTGKSYVYRKSDGKLVYAGFLIKFTPDPKILDVCFLKHYLETEQYIKWVSITSQRSGQPGINADEYYNMIIPIFLIIEQEKIAEILSTWDLAIEKQAQLIEKKKEFKKGLMQRLLSGEVRFKEFKDEWNNKTLENYILPVSRECDKPNEGYWRLGLRSHGKGTFHEFVEDPSTVSMDKLYKVKCNDLIVNITFAWEHAIAVANTMDEDKLVSHRFPTYEFKGNAYPIFFKYYILQPNFKHMLVNISPGGAGRNRVMNKKDFLKLMVKVPSYNEQVRIAEVLISADEEIELLQKELEALKLQKKGLMQRLLTGEVRVKI
ncbi:restriction endonuclease subunit S [Hathewaya massiliensis]|uniref:restriction endonuclease subunit S n=1 Tax=Hathewaya massiliensis TaxID=1964382 RepID=UPI001158A797|nr:restriction endonuclease subunit S [Hathewaya massiliensis]